MKPRVLHTYVETWDGYYPGWVVVQVLENVVGHGDTLRIEITLKRGLPKYLKDKPGEQHEGIRLAWMTLRKAESVLISAAKRGKR